MAGRWVSLVALSVLALGVTACGQNARPAAPETGVAVPAPSAPASSAPASSAPASAPASSAPAEDPAQPPASDDRNAAALRAIATAEQSEGGTAYAIDDEDDDRSWEVDVMVGDRSVEVEVSWDGNSVISRDDDDDDDDDERRALERAQVSLSEAIQAALAEVPGELDDAELDDDDDRDHWEVTIDEASDDDVEVYVSIEDGSIIKVDR